MSEPVSKKLPGLLLIAAAAIGLGVSLLLAIEYATPDPKFCGEGGGCEAIRFSDYSHIGPIPVPLFGIAFFASMLVAYVRARQYLLSLAAVGALASAWFIYVQAALVQAVCPYCVAADSAAIVAFVAAVLLHRQSPAVATGRTGMWIAYAGVLAPLGFGVGVMASTPAPHDDVPAVVVQEQRDGVATVVEFLDFQCPFCRKQHAVMKTLADEYGDRMRVVYKHVPLPGHKHAVGAARAAICAGEQDKLSAMADALLTREDITPVGCEQAAESLGLDMDAFRACVASERPAAVLEADRQAAEQAGVRGLPTFFIGTRKFEGLQKAPKVRAAIERAL